MKRASLSLTVFPAVFPAVFLACAGPACAQDLREEVLQGAARCTGITDDRTWLDCFYGAAQPMRSRLGLPPAPPAQIRLVPPPGAAYVMPASAARTPASAREQGFMADLLGSTRPTVRDMPLASYNFDRSGRFTVRLQNGQTYVQEESDLRRARWTGAASALQVTLQPSGDKYDMRVRSEPGVIYRVSRR